MLLYVYSFAFVFLTIDHRVYLYCFFAVCQPFIKLMIDSLIDLLID